MSKFFSWLKRSKNKLYVVGVTGAMACMTAVNCFAVDPTPDTTTFEAGATSIFNQVTALVNIGNVVKILVIGIPVALGLFLFWWGGRKLVRMIMGAFKKGKISV